MIIFQKEDGSPGGVGAYLLNKLRLALPGETLEPVSTLYTVLIPPSVLACKAADDWVGFPKRVGPWKCRWIGYEVGGDLTRCVRGASLWSRGSLGLG